MASESVKTNHIHHDNIMVAMSFTAILTAFGHMLSSNTRAVLTPSNKTGTFVDILGFGKCTRVFHSI